MKLAIVLLLAAMTSICSASQVDVGGTPIEIPTPSGFARVIPEMTTVVELAEHFVPPTNQQLALFISEHDVPNALEGGIPVLTRRFTVQVSRKAAGKTLSNAMFQDLKSSLKAQSDQVVERIGGNLDQLMANASKGVSRQLDVDLIIQLGGVVPLPPHYESAHAISMSMLMKADFQEKSQADFSDIVTVTSTFLVVKGRLLFLYTYGGKGDLEWTRKRSKEWAEAVIAAN